MPQINQDAHAAQSYRVHRTFHGDDCVLSVGYAGDWQVKGAKKKSAFDML